MVMKIHTDASYLSEPQAKSRVGGHFYLGSKPTQIMDNNGSILNTATILRHVVVSAAEAEYAGIFLNAQSAVALREALKEMGHMQPPKPICTDNTIAAGIANKTTKPKMSKSMDLRFHWIQDKIAQKQFNVFWKPGCYNRADYFSKHHHPSHHQRLRTDFLVNNVTTVY